MATNPQCFSDPYCGYPYFSARDGSRASEFATEMAPSHGLFERSDDVCSTAYWYQRSGAVDRLPLVPARLRRPR